jgi:hypothetical protein
MRTASVRLAQSGTAQANSTGLRLTLLLLAAATSVPMLQPAALAQVESFLWGPGSTVGPATKVEPKNCTSAADGTVTCDTQLVNPQGDTPAKPQYNPFQN